VFYFQTYSPAPQCLESLISVSSFLQSQILLSGSRCHAVLRTPSTCISNLYTGHSSKVLLVLLSTPLLYGTIHAISSSHRILTPNLANFRMPAFNIHQGRLISRIPVQPRDRSLFRLPTILLYAVACSPTAFSLVDLILGPGS
jgi:hypothetical protein